MTSIKIYWFMTIGFFLSLCVAEAVLASKDIVPRTHFMGKIQCAVTGCTANILKTCTCNITAALSATFAQIPICTVSNSVRFDTTWVYTAINVAQKKISKKIDTAYMTPHVFSGDAALMTGSFRADAFGGDNHGRPDMA